VEEIRLLNTRGLDCTYCVLGTYCYCPRKAVPVTVLGYRDSTTGLILVLDKLG
jgi:hypothetical protein